jgi:surface-anchored protein
MKKSEFQNRSPALSQAANVGRLWVRTRLVVLLLAWAMTPVQAQHLHVQLSYSSEDQWRLFIYDFDSGEFDPAEAPLYAGHRAFGFVLANSFTNFLGPAGSAIWTLPETEVADLLYLGIGTQGIAPGTFVDNRVRLELRSLTGPGHFSLYNLDPFGGAVVHMNSRDGIDPARDTLPLSSVGGHVHVNWVFSAPGSYCVGFGVSGRLNSTGQISASPVVEYTFGARGESFRRCSWASH